MESRHVSQAIPASPERVYAFAADPLNLPAWAAGLAAGEVRVLEDDADAGPALAVASPMGEVRVRFVPRNGLGVLDHDVTLPDGAVVTNPLRVLSHPEGAEVVFTVRQLDMTAEEFERDCSAVAADLVRLRDEVLARG